MAISRKTRGVVLFEDEMTVQLTPTLTRMWYPRNTQPEPTMWTGTRLKTHVFGCVNAKTGRFHSIQTDRINSHYFLQLLRKIKSIYKGKRIIIILDNAKWHKAKKVWKYLDSKSISFLFLPPYSPDMNPVEMIWKMLRKDVTHNYFHETLDKLIMNVAVFSRNLRTKKRTLISLCHIS